MKNSEVCIRQSGTSAKSTCSSEGLEMLCLQRKVLGMFNDGKCMNLIMPLMIGLGNGSEGLGIHEDCYCTNTALAQCSKQNLTTKFSLYAPIINRLPKKAHF